MNFDDQRRLVAANMQKHGGSFVNSLGHALACADMLNAGLIKQTWPQYWDKYMKFGEMVAAAGAAEKATP